LTDQSTKGIDTVSERIGIAGGGAIASGIACVAAEHGQVVLWARRPDAATARVEKLIERRGGVGAGNVAVSSDLDVLGDATFIVEAIAEEHDAKAALLHSLGAATTNGTILATTTSALSVTALARETGRPERFVGLHVFNPVPKMDLVELVFPPEAEEDTRDRARALCGALGKTAVEVPDTAGFVVNRLLFGFLFDAVALLEETGVEAARDRIEGGADAHHSTADHEHVELGVLTMPRARHRGEGGVTGDRAECTGGHSTTTSTRWNSLRSV